MRPIGIDLFAGAGGLSLGFERAGFDVVGAVEFDPIHCATHEFNFPHCASICRSVADVEGDELREICGITGRDLDVLFGGAPCQGFSMIGKRALDDPRNSLVYHFVRLASELKPKHVVFENVRGLTVGKHKEFLVEIIEAFESIGYTIRTPYQVLNASEFGVPQSRQRLFLLGARNDCALPEYPNPVPERVTVQDALSGLPDADHFDELTKWDWVRAEFGEDSEYSSMMRGKSSGADAYGYRRNHDPDLLTSSRRTAHTDKSRERFLETDPGKTEPVSRFHKLDPLSVCNTLRAGTASDRGAFTSPRPIHPYAPRVITNREAARLHSFPDWFRFHTTKWHGFRQIGNSVPPLLGQAVASEVFRCLGAKPKKPKKLVRLGNAELLEMTMATAAARYNVPSDVIPKRTRKDVERVANA